MQYLLALLAALLAPASADLFTSIADMQSLLDSEKTIPSILNKYIESERQRLDKLREYVFSLTRRTHPMSLSMCFRLSKQYEERNDAALETGMKDISNPINAFLLLKKKVASEAEVV